MTEEELEEALFFVLSSLYADTSPGEVERTVAQARAEVEATS